MKHARGDSKHTGKTGTSSVKHSAGTEKKNMPSKERVLELTRWGLYAFCFVGLLIHLTEYDNVFYQTSRDKQAGKELVYLCRRLHYYRECQQLYYYNCS